VAFLDVQRQVHDTSQRTYLPSLFARPEDRPCAGAYGTHGSRPSPGRQAVASRHSGRWEFSKRRCRSHSPNFHHTVR
jgi:hypothetical protein